MKQLMGKNTSRATGWMEQHSPGKNCAGRTLRILCTKIRLPKKGPLVEGIN
jgi:hypothetical protein